MDAANFIGLNTPARTSTNAGDFDTSPQSVASWLEQLPLGNPGETARQVYHALITINRTQYDVNTRLQNLEALRNIVFFIEDCLKKHYLRQSLPLSDRNQRLSELAQELLQEIGTGYKIVVEELASNDSRRDNKMLTMAVHRALRYIGRSLLQYYQTYAGALPAGVWHEMYKLYIFACQRGIHKASVNDTEHTKIDKSSIEDIFKQNLLLALACPYRLRQGEAETIYHALEEWVKLVELNTIDIKKDSDGVFYLDPDSDTAPAYLALEKNPATNGLTLDTSGLALKLQDEIRQSRATSNGSSAIEKNTLSRDLLRRLHTAWGVVMKRKFSRMEKHSELEIVFGMASVHKALEIAHNYTEQENLEYNAKASFSANETPDGRTPEIWELSDVPDFWGRRKQNEKAAEPGYEADEWDVVNASAGGFCLLWKEQESTKAQIGELVALHEKNTSTPCWALAVIRWMKYNVEKGLEIGIQMIAPDAFPVATRKHTTHRVKGDFHRSILLQEVPAIKQAATLLVPTGIYRKDDELELCIRGSDNHIKLRKLIETTANFSQFSFDYTHRADTGSSDPDKSAEKFDSIWSSI